MVSVICPCVECKHNGRRYRCKCKEIKLEWRNMATVNEGRVDMWVCKQYEERIDDVSRLYKQLFGRSMND